MRTSLPLRFLPALLLVACATAPARTDAPAAPTPEVATHRARPYANPVPWDHEWLQAVERGTRTMSGEPGPRYWQQWASYRLTARLNPEQRRIDGTAEIVYHNRSPDSLPTLHLDLVLNVHDTTAMRNEPMEVTGGVRLTRVAVEGTTLEELQPGRIAPGWAVMGTRLVIVAPQPVASRDSVRLSLAWELPVPQAGAGGRMGWDGDDVFFIAYWYPQMTVYDDVVGWHPDPFLGTAEFYHGFAGYELTVDAPDGWIVRATGRHENPDAVLAPGVLARLRAAEASDTAIRIVGPADFATATRRGTGGRLQWTFTADSVRDVAFSATRRSIWEGARTGIGDRTGDGRDEHAQIEALWRETAPRWRNMVRYAQHSLDFLSRYTGIPYPWPHMTAVEAGGIIGGGMEFPMMTLIGDYNARGDSALYYVTAHELAHMWVPMIVSTDERRYAWLDEGTTTYNENEARMEFFPGVNHHVPDQETYIGFARTGYEGEIMRWSNYHYSPMAYGVASYPKPASVLLALRGVLGDETFHRAYRRFLSQWAWKHPTPWDMFRTFESVSGRDLEWFWRAWYYETWRLDQGIASVTETPSGTLIVVEDHGDTPMPVRLAITRADGRVERREVPVEVWLRGARRAAVTLAPGAAVMRVEIDPEQFFPDVDRENNLWEAGRTGQMEP